MNHNCPECKINKEALFYELLITLMELQLSFLNLTLLQLKYDSKNSIAFIGCFPLLV